MTKAIAAVGFDYEGIDKDTKGKLTYLAGQVRKSTKSHIEYAIAMGESVSQANELLATAGCESRFGAWVQAECGFSRKSAYNYMNAYARFGEESCKLTQFTAEAIYLLSADSTPESAVKKALKLADKGTRITLDQASELKKEAIAAEEPDEPEDEPDESQVVDPASVVEVSSTPVDPPKSNGQITGGTAFNVEELTGESTDAFGDQAPAALKQVFELCEEFDAQRAKLAGIKSWMTQRLAHPGAAVLVDAAQRIKTDLDHADAELKFAKPYCVCVYCKNEKPKVANCNACKGRGWMTEQVYKAAPKGMKREKAQA